MKNGLKTKIKKYRYSTRKNEYISYGTHPLQAWLQLWGSYSNEPSYWSYDEEFKIIYLARSGTYVDYQVEEL